jgi:hypothetical protein
MMEKALLLIRKRSSSRTGIMHLAGNEFMIVTEKWTLSHAMMGEIILVFNI